jgi:hypothetical protein
MIIEGKELPARVNPNARPAKEDLQQVLKPGPGQQPNVTDKCCSEHKVRFKTGY